MSDDFNRVEFGAQSAPRAAPRPAAGPDPIDTPTAAAVPAQKVPQESSPLANDSVLVPLDQWNRLLGQLGNIHEASQQLAEARERMGRAETENVFLKERLRDLRAEVERNQLERDEAPAAPVDPPTPEAPAFMTPPGRTLNIEFKIPAWMARRRRRA